MTVRAAVTAAMAVLVLLLAGLPVAANETNGADAAASARADALNRNRRFTPPAAYRGFTDFGCYDDPIEDLVQDGAADNPQGEPGPAADLLQYCVSHEPFPEPGDEDAPVLFGFSAQVLEPADPLGDPAWGEDNTFIGLLVDTDGDEDAELIVQYEVLDGALAAGVFNIANDTLLCEGEAAFTNGMFAVRGIPAECLGSPDQIRFFIGISRQEPGESGFLVDFAPNEQLYDGPLTDAAAPGLQCPEPLVDEGTTVDVVRVSSCVGGTEPISQAVAVSEITYSTFNAAAVILARSNDFPDALSGSGLAFGLGPVLYTYAPNDTDPTHDPTRLPPNTRAEVTRVLPRGQTVYLMGGTAAIHPGVEQELVDLGFRVVRFAGATREETAALVSSEVRALLEGFAAGTGFPDLRSVIVATRSNWPDAVVAGSISAFWGMPILLTDATSINPATQAALEAIDPEYIYVIGGSAVISRDVLAALQPFASGSATRPPFCPPADDNGDGTPDRFFNACRIGGENRVLTALGVGELNRYLLAQNPDADNPNGSIPPDSIYAAAVNMFRADGFTHALSATSFTGAFGGAAFIPLSGDAGDSVDVNTEVWICEFLPQLQFLFLMGDRDLVSDGVGQNVRSLLEGRCT